MRRWTKEEDEYLLHHYKNVPFDDVRAYLSNRPNDAIRWRAKFVLGVASSKNKPWTVDELNILLSDLTISEVANLTGRTYSAVNKRRNLERAKGSLSELFDTSTIEKGVPNISRSSKSAQHFALLLELQVGDSYEFPANEYPLVRNQIQIITERKFESKKWSDGTRRIWRIE
ncbi:MAG: hypothetical protein ACRCZZ_01450 [Phocaeicola sp.]